MSTHVYFYTIFFLKPWFSEINGWWESGREWRDTGADPGVLQICVCVFRGDTSFCVLSVTVPDWLPCFRSAPGPDIFSLKQAANTKAG